MSSAAYQGFGPRQFKTLLGSARPVSDQWADLREPWQPDLEKLKDKSGLLPPSLTGIPGLAGILPVSPSGLNPANRPPQPSTRQDNDSSAGILPADQSTFLSDGTATLSDALPDPVVVGQQYAAGGASGRVARRGGPPESPSGELLSSFYVAYREALRELEPNNSKLVTIRSPDWRPTQRDVDEIQHELLEARQRAPGAIDTRQSGIGIGPFAKGSIPARSEKRDFNAWERLEINRLGLLYGCHTCGTRDPGTRSGNFILDHQRPSSVNTAGEQQRLFPQCLSCSARQGARLSREIDK